LRDPQRFAAALLKLGLHDHVRPEAKEVIRSDSLRPY